MHLWYHVHIRLVSRKLRKSAKFSTNVPKQAVPICPQREYARSLALCSSHCTTPVAAMPTRGFTTARFQRPLVPDTDIPSFGLRSLDRLYHHKLRNPSPKPQADILPRPPPPTPLPIPRAGIRSIPKAGFQIPATISSLSFSLSLPYKSDIWPPCFTVPNPWTHDTSFPIAKYNPDRDSSFLSSLLVF